MRVLIVEDNSHHAERVKTCLEKIFVDVLISVLSTEHAVVSNIDKIAAGQVDIIILDVVLPWCEPTPEMPEPPEGYDTKSPYRAGIRCLKLFLNHAVLRDIPVIVHSVVEPETLKGLPDNIPPSVLFLSKPLEPERMAQTVESFLMSLKPQRRSPSRLDAIKEATEIKFGCGDFKIDLKKALKRKS